MVEVVGKAFERVGRAVAEVILSKTDVLLYGEKTTVQSLEG